MLVREPLCRQCARAGLTVAAEEVDHVRPVSAGGDPWAAGNIQPLCRRCHEEKSAAETRARAAARLTPQRRAWRDRLAAWYD